MAWPVLILAGTCSHRASDRGVIARPVPRPAEASDRPIRLCSGTRPVNLALASHRSPVVMENTGRCRPRAGAAWANISF